MATMRDDIEHKLTDAGYGSVQIKTQLSPPWSSDWISEEGLAKLRTAGYSVPGAAPRRTSGPDRLDLDGQAARHPVPPVRFGKHQTEFGIRCDPVQSALSLPRLPRAVRSREGDLNR